MNQVKFGRFLKQLRKEKQITQEQFSEILGISNRTISRWENGNNMPDLDYIIEISKYFNVGIDELLKGERRIDNMDKTTETAIVDIANYSNDEKIKITNRANLMFFIGTIAIIIYIIIHLNNLVIYTSFNNLSDFMLGLSVSTLVCGLIFTSKIIFKLNRFKKRIISKYN